PGPPPPPPTAITLPDGSTANARTPELAQAVKAHLDGKPLEEAYREQHLELPPPGTPVTAPVDPSRLSAGMLAVFNDHYAVALSSVKALQDGQVVPASMIASSPGFLGWLDPSAVGAPEPTPAPAPVPVPPSSPATDPANPAPLASAPVPTPIG
ncbi:MAG TPA: Biofilm regulator BssS, partial [Mycobacterium sp.]|nr:Biofilm regulator BssS [Mycobacterium sp.]